MAGLNQFIGLLYCNTEDYRHTRESPSITTEVYKASGVGFFIFFYFVLNFFPNHVYGKKNKT